MSAKRDEPHEDAKDIRGGEAATASCETIHRLYKLDGLTCSPHSRGLLVEAHPANVASVVEPWQDLDLMWDLGYL